MGGESLEKYEYFCDEQSCDDCHPNDAGYKAMAKFIYESIDLNPIHRLNQKFNSPLSNNDRLFLY